MKTCKGLLLKVKKGNKTHCWQSWFGVTPKVFSIQGFSTSPILRWIGQQCTWTLLPTAGKLLQPNSDPRTTARSLAARKRSHYKQSNSATKNLTPMKVGEAIRMKLPEEQKWSLGHCSHLLGWRSYEVLVDGQHSTETAASRPPPYSHHQCQIAIMKNHNRLRTKVGHHTRLRMKADHLFFQSLYQASAKHHLLLWLRRMAHRPKHALSQTVQTQYRLS